LIVLFLTSCATNSVDTTKADYGKYPDNYVEIIKNYFKDKLLDPYSTKYRMSKPYKAYTRFAPIAGGTPAQFGYMVDVGVNSKNKLGAYVGEHKFRLFIENSLNVSVIASNSWFSDPWFKPQFSNELFEITQSEKEIEKNQPKQKKVNITIPLAKVKKPHMKHDCNIRGSGTAECTFRNTGKKKDSICLRLVIDFLPGSIGYEMVQDYMNKQKPKDAISMKTGLSKVCSGLVEPQDVRQMKQNAGYPFELPSVCSGSEISNWTLGCVVKWVEVDS